MRISPRQQLFVVALVFVTGPAAIFADCPFSGWSPDTECFPAYAGWQAGPGSTCQKSVPTNPFSPCTGGCNGSVWQTAYPGECKSTPASEANGTQCRTGGTTVITLSQGTIRCFDDVNNFSCYCINTPSNPPVTTNVTECTCQNQ